MTPTDVLVHRCRYRRAQDVATIENAIMISFVEEAKRVGAELGIVPTIIRGEELRERGFGGIYGVGKAAAHPPALVVLSHKPAKTSKAIAWVGKGIVYDTGGLSIKVNTW